MPVILDPADEAPGSTRRRRPTAARAHARACRRGRARVPAGQPRRQRRAPRRAGLPGPAGAGVAVLSWRASAAPADLFAQPVEVAPQALELGLLASHKVQQPVVGGDRLQAGERRARRRAELTARVDDHRPGRARDRHTVNAGEERPGLLARRADPRCARLARHARRWRCRRCPSRS